MQMTTVERTQFQGKGKGNPAKGEKSRKKKEKEKKLGRDKFENIFAMTKREILMEITGKFSMEELKPIKQRPRCKDKYK